MQNYIRHVGERVLDGDLLSFSEAAKLLEANPRDLIDLLGIANRVRRHFLGDVVEFCTIINAKSGRCSENCRFCSQSAHYAGESAIYPMLDVAGIVAAAKDADHRRIKRFSIVTSGRILTDRDLEIVYTAAEHIKQETRLLVDCSLGFITAEQAVMLKKAGVERYHHNLETAESFFARVCSTHSFGDKLETISRIQAAGMSVCSGGIIGLGETPAQWLELVFQLRELAVDCIPVNILNPRPGTPLEHNSPPPPLQILKILAIMRLIAPRTEIKLAGGREANLRDFQATAFLAGVTGMIVGGYLTTSGRSVEEDFQMIDDLGLRFDERY